MRIAMLGWEFPPFVSGGLGRHCYWLTKSLGSSADIDYFMPNSGFPINAPWLNLIQVSATSVEETNLLKNLNPYKSSFGNSFGEKKAQNASKLSEAYGFDFFQAVSAYNILAVKSVLKRHAEKSFDVIHCHDWLTVKAGIELKKRLGIPLVVTFHSTEFDRTANLWPFWWIVAAERDAVLNADLIIAVSERIKRELVEQYGANPFKVRVVYNAIDQSELKSEAKKEHLGVSGNVVLFHGRLSVQKGPEFFLKAAKKVLEKNKGVRFVLSGKGDLLPRLVDLSIELGISDKVTFTGYLPQEQLADLYAVSDVFVLPAVSEPFGITVLEAMAAGVPCVISKTTGVGEIVNHCLRVDFWDVDELANKILGLLNYSELKELVKREAIREVKKFTWEDCASKTLWVYSEALRNRNN